MNTTLVKYLELSHVVLVYVCYSYIRIILILSYYVKWIRYLMFVYNKGNWMKKGSLNL